MGYVANEVQKTFPQTAVQNTTAPTFSGISSATPNADGSISLNWALATGAAATPVRYKLYIALGANVPATSLFVLAITTGLAR